MREPVTGLGATGMKFTLAIVLAILAWAGSKEVLRAQAPQEHSQNTKMPQASGAEASPQQPATPPPASQPCTQSKDTCELSEPAPQQPATGPATPTQEQPPAKPATKSAASKKKRAHRHKVASKQATAQNGSGLKKTIVREGSTSDPSVLLTPGATPQQGYSRQLTADLLSATDSNLKQASSRHLNTNEQETVSQIRLFMEQANGALKAGDLDRGYNLALKAHLLSDDLVKH